MISVPLFDMQGNAKGELAIDPACLGGRVRPRLIKQAIVAYQDHLRQDSARTKGRADVIGSTRKLYRQKGTGNARVGNIRTPVRRGGGRTFSKRGPRALKGLPKKMKRMARDSAILAKLNAQEVLVIEEWNCAEPKTKPFAAMLKAVGAEKGCLIALGQQDDNVYRSCRNLMNTEIRTVEQLNAYEVMRRPKLVLGKSAFDRLCVGKADVVEDGSAGAVDR
ncbi:MAG: 50S ribosomal protein L4 [Phycisphaerae bacterium]